MSQRDDDVVWIEARERGERVGDHPRAGAYRRLGLAIGTLPDFDGGGTGWAQAIFDQLALPDAAAAARARRKRRWATGAGVGLAAALAALLYVKTRPAADDDAPPPREDRAPANVEATLLATVEPGPARRAEPVSGEASIGDTMVFVGAGGPAAQLWIYRGESLVLRCPGPADGCALTATDRGTQVTARVRASAALRYTGVLVDLAGAAPQGELTLDTERLGTVPQYSINVR